jgi:hypothetical protein
MSLLWISVPENQNYTTTFCGILISESSAIFVGQFIRYAKKPIIALSKLGCVTDQEK